MTTNTTTTTTTNAAAAAGSAGVHGCDGTGVARLGISGMGMDPPILFFTENRSRSQNKKR